MNVIRGIPNHGATPIGGSCLMIRQQSSAFPFLKEISEALPKTNGR